MSRKAPSNLDLYLGSPVLPAQVRRVRTDHRGALTFHVDSEEHDLGLLHSLACAVRDPETVDLLREYADLIDAADAAERQGEAALKRSLDDDALDLRSQIEAVMDGQAIGESHVATLRPADSAALVAALAGDRKAVA